VRHAGHVFRTLLMARATPLARSRPHAPRRLWRRRPGGYDVRPLSHSLRSNGERAGVTGGRLHRHRCAPYPSPLPASGEREQRTDVIPTKRCNASRRAGTQGQTSGPCLMEGGCALDPGLARGLARDDNRGRLANRANLPQKMNPLERARIRHKSCCPPRHVSIINIAVRTGRGRLQHPSRHRSRCCRGGGRAS
jgi:hypothetical protein